MNDLPPVFVNASYTASIFEETTHVYKPILKVETRTGARKWELLFLCTYMSGIQIRIQHE